MSDKFLKDTYNLDSPQATRTHYEKWAASYDEEVAEHGYATPGRVADALWAQLPEPQTPVLDFGCGTGLSGVALSRVGYKVIDGIDPTPKMLEGARAKGVYRNLSTFEITDPAPLSQGAYKAITFVIEVPEPATLLLLGIPAVFVRRRT